MASKKPPLFSKEQRDAIERELGHPYGMVSMRADGHQLDARVVKWKGLRYVVMLFVDGVFKGESMRAESDIGRKFYREKTVSFVKARKGGLTKREAARLRKKYSAKMHEPWYPNARSLLKQLQQTVATIEEVVIGYPATNKEGGDVATSA